MESLTEFRGEPLEEPNNSFVYPIGRRDIHLVGIDRRLGQQFANLHQAVYERKDVDNTNLRDAIWEFFDSKKDWKSHDILFNCFVQIWDECLRQGNPPEALALWNDFALGCARDWEERNHPSRIHKGTPYYYLGGTYIYLENYQTGFFLMHQAFEEDKRILGDNAVNSPAGCFVTLNSEKAEQFFRPYVQKIAGYLDDKMEYYRRRIKGALSLEEFRGHFLSNPQFLEQVFLFSHLLWNLRRLQKRDIQNWSGSFAALLSVQIAFGLCLVFDEIVASKDQKKSTSEHVDTVSKGCLPHGRGFGGRISDLNNSRRAIGFEKTLEAVLRQSFRFSDSHPVSQIEWDLTTLYITRNFAAHNIKSYEAVNRHFEEIVQCILDCLFFAVEKLLP